MRPSTEGPEVSNLESIKSITLQLVKGGLQNGDPRKLVLKVVDDEFRYPITSDALQNVSQVSPTPHCGAPTTPVTSQ
ncbi:hypothetical protein E2C01_048108 [Portunus trituberculatus]|uniref:Uncharacterized protein n=1 Tax=Portunus trituberculatus TaxID=210409 RepID=A0A5B7G2A2_PORTR|nr:hypothetical protein [Portunus trituberculatus]